MPHRCGGARRAAFHIAYRGRGQILTLTDIPTEQATAATDLALAMLAGAAAAWLKRRGPRGFRGRLWRTVFLVLAIAGLAGAIAHGVVLGEDIYIGLWRALYLALALLVASFFLATVRDLAGDALARRVLPAVLLVALAFYAYSQLDPDNFRPFVVYESAAMALSLAGYLWIAIRGTQPGAAWIVAAIVTNIVAAAIQAARGFGFTPAWYFDHNGVFHLVQMAGIVLLARGLVRRGDDQAGSGREGLSAASAEGPGSR